MAPAARTWRDIPQDLKPRAMSSEGKRRFAFATGKTLLWIATAGLALWGGFALFQTLQNDPSKLQATAKGVPIKRPLAVRTNGVLDAAWIEQALALPSGASLMDINLAQLQDRLLAHGQVSTAVITRKFPDTLSVIIEERSPVARVMLQAGGQEPELYLVARDGTVYQGHGYDSALVQSFPYLDGVKLPKTARGYAKIEGMEAVADLLSTAYTNAPQLYMQWSVVSLARLTTDGTLIVKMPQVPEVIFGLREDFFKQLARLDYALDELARQPDLPPLRTINLAVGGAQVPIAFMTPPAAFVESAKPATTTRQPTRRTPPTPAPLFRVPPTRPTAQNPYFNPKPANQINRDV